jgi:hypothetical protein
MPVAVGGLREHAPAAMAVKNKTHNAPGNADHMLSI